MASFQLLGKAVPHCARVMTFPRSLFNPLNSDLGFEHPTQCDCGHIPLEAALKVPIEYLPAPQSPLSKATNLGIS
jgi:hypothetical protein